MAKIIEILTKDERLRLKALKDLLKEKEILDKELKKINKNDNKTKK